MGIAAGDIAKLKTAGIWTVDGLAHAPKRELENIKGLSAAKVDKLLKEGSDMLCSMLYCSALDVA